MTMRPIAATLAAAGLLLGIAACGTQATSDPDETTESNFPITVTNCGNDVDINQPPERVVLLTGTDVSYLGELDLLDRVIAKAGAYDPEYHSEEINEMVADIPELSSTLDESASLAISDEVIIESNPDLVIDAVQTDRAASLGQLGIPVINDEAMCPEGLAEPSFDAVYTQFETFGRIFDVEERAADAITGINERVSEVQSGVDHNEVRTAAALYPIIGGSPRAYGNRSMAGVLLQEAGFENVYDDLDERRAEISIEDLIGRDPDVLVLLHVEGEPQEVEEALTSLPGAADLRAVRDDQVLTMLFNFAEPPTPLAVDGLEQIVSTFSTRQ